MWGGKSSIQIWDKLYRESTEENGDIKMAGKKQRPYEYARALKKQSPEIKAMITAGEKADEAKKAAAKKAVAKKAVITKKQKERRIWKRAKRRLKKLFG